MTSTACDELQWESADDSFLRDGIDSLTSLKRTPCGSEDDERPSLDMEADTIVTDQTDDAFESALEESDSDGEQQCQDDDNDDEEEVEDDEYEHLSNCYPQGVPAEVNVSFCENDNDNDSDSECDEHDHSDSESELDPDESEEELSEEEEDINDDDADEEDSEAEYETDDADEDSIDADIDIESEHSETEDDSVMDDDDYVSCCSTPSISNSILSSSQRPSDDDDHELFLPEDVSPSVESLKYEPDDESSDEEDDDDHVSHYHHRTYMMGNNRSGRPRMWDGCPSSISVSSGSSSSSDGSRRSQESDTSKHKTPVKSGVSFNDSVTVYPVFETSAYSSAMVQNIYTKRDELRINKLRNKREYAYDSHDWRNVTEEDEMEANDEGELVHPVHVTEKQSSAPGPCRTRNVVQTYSSTMGGYHVGGMSSSGVVHRAKRMRMYYP